MMKNQNRSGWSTVVAVAMLLVLAAVASVATFALDASPARAVIGRPFTPLSYAGVARRTSRRVARRTVYRHTAYATALPAAGAGCAYVGGVYNCGDAAYRPYYDGPNLVYVEAD